MCWCIFYVVLKCFLIFDIEIKQGVSSKVASCGHYFMSFENILVSNTSNFYWL